MTRLSRSSTSMRPASPSGTQKMVPLEVSKTASHTPQAPYSSCIIRCRPMPSARHFNMSSSSSPDVSLRSAHIFGLPVSGGQAVHIYAQQQL